jgi:hypothetical protein
MDKAHYTGGCLCGSVRYQVSGQLRHLCYCHCNSCRRAAGAPMVPWGTVDSDGWRVTRGQLTQFRSSPPVLRGFCAACGTSLTYHNDAHPGEIDVAIATLDDPTPFAPQLHLWVADKLPWVAITDGLPQYRGSRSAGPP